MSRIPKTIITLIDGIHHDFIWNRKRANIKHSTLIGDYSLGGLKDVDIHSKFKSLHLSWLKRLSDCNFHPWKLIPLYYLNSASSNTILFLPNLSISDSLIKDVPEFYKNIIQLWKDTSQSSPTTASMVLSESLWFNSNISINNRSIAPSFCNKNSNIFLRDLFSNNGQFITWDMASFKLNIKDPFKWFQIMSAIPKAWKNILRNVNNPGDTVLDIHLNKDIYIIYNIYIIL